MKHKSPFQVRTPLTAQTLPQLPQPGLPGAYSVELVSRTLTSPPDSQPHTTTWQTTPSWAGRLVCWRLVLLSFQIYPHRFPGTAGVNPAQVARHAAAALKSPCEKSKRLIFSFLLRCSPFPLMASSSTPSLSHQADRVWKWWVGREWKTSWSYTCDTITERFSHVFCISCSTTPMTSPSRG